MKKVYLQLLFCMLPTYAIPPSVVAALMGTVPVTVPGTYYWCKTKRLQYLCRESGHSYCSHTEHELRAPFSSGMLCGAIPGVNVFFLGLTIVESPIWVPDLLFGNGTSAAFCQYEKPEVTGFVGGLSLYATIPLALEYARKGARR